MPSNFTQKLAVMSALAFSSASALAVTPDTATNHYKVSVENVTAGNLLSPYLVIVHKANSKVFEARGVATPGLQQIAETGATDLIQAELEANPEIISVTKVEGSPLVAAEARAVNFDVSKSAVKSGALVTVIAMIGKSNDSFIGIRCLPLTSITTRGYTTAATNFDAGTEENTGNVEDLNATSHPVGVVEGHISYDRGLNPNGNAPEILRWGSVAAKATFNKL